jgi:hypothetical protein
MERTQTLRKQVRVLAEGFLSKSLGVHLVFFHLDTFVSIVGKFVNKGEIDWSHTLKLSLLQQQSQILFTPFDGTKTKQSGPQELAGNP